MQLEIRDLSKSYGKVKALRSVSLCLKPGIHALLGINGAGKTTLIRILCGLLSRDKGDILVDGKPLQSVYEYLSELGYLPQYPEFYPHMRVDEFLSYISFLKHLSVQETRERVEELMSELHLTQYRTFRIRELSGGTRQRVGIAQALLNRPQLLILDEPTAGLDPRERVRFRNLITRYAEGKIVLLATHLVSDAESIASVIILIHEGKVCRVGSMDELTRELEGKIWEIRSDRYPECEHISQVRRIHNGYSYRLLGEVPHELKNVARPVAAEMEDVFLYHTDAQIHEEE